MTREELITIAAVEHTDKQLQRVDEFDFAVAAIADYDNGFTDGFKQGAQWADAHPQFSREEFIDKAAEWIRDNVYLYVSDLSGTVSEQQLTEAFTAAMEE